MAGPRKLTEADVSRAAALLSVEPYPDSVAETEAGEGIVFVGRRGPDKFVCTARAGDTPVLDAPVLTQGSESGLTATLHEMGHAAAAAVRRLLPWCAPVVLGTPVSMGLGDRLGIATPGHIRAVMNTGVRPVLAQQSVRELARTERTFQQVMDTATWGVLQAGWREGFGSDADHLKSAKDADAAVEAGFTMFTVDPGAYVDDSAAATDVSALQSSAEDVPWQELETTAVDCLRDYSEREFALPGDVTVRVSAEEALRAAVKYGRAMAHTVAVARHLADRMGHRPWELEVSVDETDSPTTPQEHLFIARELGRLGVEFVGLAPRFVGEFEKGVDYRGDLAEFESSFRTHAAIARHLGPYKLSIHSGSDKFLIYPIMARLSQGLVHLKTAGTSYLVALQVVARADPQLLRRILTFARERWDEDRASYHVSAELHRVPRPEQIADSELEALIEQHDARQLVHCTFGSALTSRNADGSYRFRDSIYEVLTTNEELHYELLEKHLGRHVAPFAE